MALDFPSNPSVGTVFNNYVWNGTAWAGIGSANNLGVQVATLQTNAAQDYHPNYIINGGFDIWQRGTSVTNNTNYLADRWVVTVQATGQSTNQSRVTTTLQGKLGYALRVVSAASVTSVGEYAARQPIERGNIEPLAGKTVTLSFWYRSNRTGTHGARIIGNGGNNPGGVDWPTSFTVSAADTWQRYSITSSVPFGGITGWGSSSPTDVGAYVDIGFKAGNSGPGFTSLSANDYFEITGVQLEEGQVATPFRRNANSIQGELAVCQRYYVRFVGGAAFSNMPVYNAGAQTASTILAAITVPVTMRAFPSSVEFFALRAVNMRDNFAVSVSSIALSAGWASAHSPVVTINVSGGLTANETFRIGADNNGGSYLGLSAEL